MRWMALGFAALGFLVGNLVGLTAHSVVTSVLTLIFACAGGSVVAFLGKLNSDDRRAAGQMLFSLSVFCVLGTYTGIAISEWHLLSPRISTVSSLQPQPLTDKVNNGEIIALKTKYLDYLPVKEVDEIDWELRQKRITAQTAYDRLYSLLQKSPQTSSGGGQR
jgi:hypothetical protein